MTQIHPGRRWSVDAFAAFWKKPDPSRATEVLTEDVVGHWPRPIGDVRGPRDYINVIATMLRVAPDFTVRVEEHALSGDLTFIRWVATMTGPDGKAEFGGCDRVRARNGHVCENYVFCDHPFFAHVGDEIAGA
jgi:hypothetical protein